MERKLFVGGLAWATRDDGLRAAFEEYGEVVEAAVVTDRFSGRSRGFGFVTFAGDDGAEKAVENLNGQELDGRQIKVEFAKAPRRRPESDRDRAPTRDRW